MMIKKTVNKWKENTKDPEDCNEFKLVKKKT